MTRMFWFALVVIFVVVSVKAFRSLRIPCQFRSLSAKIHEFSDGEEKSQDIDDVDIDCKSGSCRQIRGDFKKELNKQREEKRLKGPEEDYLAKLSGTGSPPVSGKKQYGLGRRKW